MKQRILLLFINSILSSVYISSFAQITSNYTETLIHVGVIEVSKTSFIKDIRGHIASTKTNKQDSSDLNKWYNNYLDDLLLTNCAIDNGITNRADVEQHVVGFAKYILIQQGSPFYQANINSKITVSPAELEEAYNKMTTIINFSLIRFSNSETYYNTLKGHMPSNAIFERLKNTINDSIQYINSILKWPSFEFWHLQYKIKSLKIGEIAGPINAKRHEISNPVYLIRVDSIRQNSRLSFDLEKQRLEMILNKIKEDSIYDYYEKSIFQKAKIQLSEKSLSDSLIHCFIKHCADPNDINFKPYLKILLMTFSFNGIPVLVHVDDFLKYYMNLPIRLNLNQRGDIINFLNYFVLSSYMVNDASIANFDKEINFLTLKEDFRNKFALQKFEEELFNTVLVSDLECKSYYQSHIQDFYGPTNANVSLLMFDTETDALAIKNVTGNLNTASFEEKLKSNILYPKIKSIHNNVDIMYSDSLNYPVNLIKQVFEVKDNSFIGPFKINNQFVLVFKKKSSGNRLKSFDESKGQIYSYLKGQKFIGVKNNVLKQAREKYPFYKIPTFQQVKQMIH